MSYKHSLVELLSNAVNLHSTKDAIVFGDVRLTYKELWEQSCGIADYLIKNGLNPEDRVALLVDNSPEYVMAYYGVLIAGGAVIGLNMAAKSRDLINWIQHSETSFLIANVKHIEFKTIHNDLKLVSSQVIKIADTDNEYEYTDWHSIESQSTVPIINQVSSNNLASIIYTSGTTGKPKGVMLSHENLYCNIKSILEYLQLESTDSIVNILPFYYSYGNSILHSHLAVGATVILENSLLYPQRLLELMQKEKITGFSGVPSTFNLLLSRTELDDFDLSSIRYVTQAGGAMAPSSIAKLLEKLPTIDFYVMYGQTEASARLSYLPPNMLSTKMGSIGVAIPGVLLEIRDENKKSVGSGETGQIFAKGKNIMIGYWKDEQATSNTILDGWLMTGDLAYKDEDGYIYIVGRATEMIKSGAHRISPKDIEEVIIELDGIEEVAIIGVDDDLLGQVIKAFIVCAPTSDVDKMKIMRHCKMNLANYKIPKQIEFAEEIPRTASGKVRRFMLQ